MRRFAHAVPLAIALAAPSAVPAQDTARALTVKTFTLHRLTPSDAATLVSPYVTSPSGGVFVAGREIRAITVREAPHVITRIDSVLRIYDKTPPMLRVRIQLIGAEDQATRDPAIADVDSALRGLFRFAGYRLLSQGVTTAAPNESFSLTLLAGQQRLLLRGELINLLIEGGKATSHLRVYLSRAEVQRTPEAALLSTGLSVPLGQTVVLGSAVAHSTYQALVLTLRAELVEER